MAKLILKRNSEVIQQLELSGPRPIYLIGSAPSNDLVVSDKLVAPHHLRIQQHNGCFYIEALDSFVGTSLNGRPLIDRVQIVDGDDVTLGEYNLLFENSSTTTIKIGIEDNELEIIGEDDIPDLDDSLTDRETLDFEEIKPTASTDNTSTNSHDLFEVEEFPEEILTEELTASALTPQIPPAKSLTLLAIYGPYIGKKFSLNENETKIGRDLTLNDIVIRNAEDGELDPSISRRHATISKRNGFYYISDKRSKTRTYVNQRKLEPTDEVLINENDEIEIVSDKKSTIFRVLSENTVNIAPPKKAGLWWIRNKLRLGFLLTIIFAFLSMAVFGISWNTRLVFSKAPDELKLFEEIWLQNSTNMSTEAALALADLTGDEKVDVVFVNPQGHLIAMNGATKETLWIKEHLQVQGNLAVVSADLNLNEISDVLVVGQDSRLYAFDGISGAEIWLSPILSGKICGPPVVQDFNNDGIQDILLCSQDGTIHIGNGSIFQPEWKSFQIELPLSSPPVVADLNKDGNLEVFIASDDAKIVMINGITGSISRIIDLHEHISLSDREDIPQNLTYLIATGNLINGNDYHDLLVRTSLGQYIAINGENLEPVWSADLLIDSDFENKKLSHALGKFNNDEIDDALLVSSQTLRALGGSIDTNSNPQVLWQYELQGEDYFITPVALADFNRDSISDIVIGSQEGTIFVLNGNDGNIISRIYHENNPAVSPILVGDLGEDGFLDLLFIRKNSNIYKIYSNASTPKNRIAWGQLYNNETHTSQFVSASPSTFELDIFVSICIFMFLVFGVFTFRGYSSRRKKFQLPNEITLSNDF